MTYEEAFWRQINFVKDELPYAFYNKYLEVKDNPIIVIDTHTSKSILLPVYQMKLNDELTLILRNNFHEWIVSVDSKKEINLDLKDLFETNNKINGVYCSGIPEDKVFDCYDNNKKQFTFEVYNNYKLYTFLFMLRNI